MKFSFGALAGIGLGAAGAITGNPLLIAAGAKVLGTSIQADAAKQAADTQVAASEKARAESDALYNTAKADANALYSASRQNFDPYLQMGSGAMGHLGQLVGLPPGGGMTPAATAPAAPTVPGQVPAGMPGSTPLPAQAAGAPSLAGPQLRGAALNESGIQGKREGMDLGNLGGLVLLRAPTGELKRVPQAQADSFVQRGAQVVR